MGLCQGGYEDYWPFPWDQWRLKIREKLANRVYLKNGCSNGVCVCVCTCVHNQSPHHPRYYKYNSHMSPFSHPAIT